MRVRATRARGRFLTSLSRGHGLGDRGHRQVVTGARSCPHEAHLGLPAPLRGSLDGIKCAQFDGNASTIENGPMQIILDVMVDNTWQRAWKVGLLDSTLTRQLEVDYIRVFQQY